MTRPIHLLLAAAMLIAPRAGLAQSAADSVAIRAAALDYIEGFYLGDSTRHLRSIRPEVYKYGYYRAEDSTSYRGMQMTWAGFANFGRGVREGRIKTPPDAPKFVQLLDVQDQTAAVRVDAYWGSDYLLLGKQDGRWMIGHVSWQTSPKGFGYMFAPATVSTGNVYRGSFEPDGKTFYFFRKTGAPSSEDYTIFRTRLVDGRWSAEERVDLGTSKSDLYPAVSPDGKRMVFASYRPAPGDTAAAHPNAYLWMAERAGDGWGTPTFLGNLSVFGFYHPQPYFGPNGDLYFNRSGPPGSRLNGTFTTRWNGTSFEAPVRWDAIDKFRAMRPDVQMFEAAPSPDGSYAIITAAAMDHEHRRRYPADLWVSFRDGSEWSTPKPLCGGINTQAVENFPFFSPGGEELYFVRDYGRVYRVPVREVVCR